MPMAVEVTITDNRRTMVSARRDGGRFHVRLHHMFLRAPESVLRAVAGYVTRRSASDRRALQAYVDAHRHRIRPAQAAPAPRRPRVRPVGRHVDLGEVLKRLNRRCFGGVLECRITWGSRRRPGRKTVRLGSYAPAHKLIRVHPVLDRSSVPAYVIEAVVYHEMLHHVLGSVRRGGRNHVHTPAFRRMEEAFPATQRAARWLDRHLPALQRKRLRSSTGTGS